MSTKITINTTGSAVFTVSSFFASIIFSPGGTFNLSFTVDTATSASVLLGFAFAPGNINISINSSNVTNISIPNTTIGTFIATFTNFPSLIVQTGQLIIGPTGNSIITSIPLLIAVACLHGSNLVQMKDGTKRIDEIKKGDQVLTGSNKYAEVKELVFCWLTHMGFDHDAVIFEKDSIGNDEPSQRLIIDPGHPMCTKREFLENGYEALRPAGSYWEENFNGQIYIKKWTDIFVQKEPSVRYDLILEEPHNTYIANEMVVRAKGYKNNTYKEFV